MKSKAVRQTIVNRLEELSGAFRDLDLTVRGLIKEKSDIPWTVFERSQVLLNELEEYVEVTYNNKKGNDKDDKTN